jgi:lipid A disaccharide synthetase
MNKPFETGVYTYEANELIRFVLSSLFLQEELKKEFDFVRNNYGVKDQERYLEIRLGNRKYEKELPNRFLYKTIETYKRELLRNPLPDKVYSWIVFKDERVNYNYYVQTIFDEFTDYFLIEFKKGA